jgi:hypothetical protein
VDRYLRKVERYELEPAGRETHPLIMSDVASSLPLVGEIDAALALEITIDQVFPQAFADNARRLYATEGAARDHGGEVITPAGIRAAFAEGYSLAFHNGHGSHGSLTSVMGTELVASLDSALPPVMLSCACLSCNFADVANTSTFDGWSPQGPGEDSAAEWFILGEGGGVAYVGSTGTGLGPIGGSQMLHAALEGLFLEGLPTVGEALAHGRAHMREVSLRIMGFDMPMNDASERWTQLVTILLGDPSLRMWSAPCRAVAVDAPADYGPGYQELVLTVTDAAGGSPVAGATVVLRKEGDFLLRGLTDDAGAVTFSFLPRGADDLELMVTGPDLLPVQHTIAPVE